MLDFRIRIPCQSPDSELVELRNPDFGFQNQKSGFRVVQLQSPDSNPDFEVAQLGIRIPRLLNFKTRIPSCATGVQDPKHVVNALVHAGN